MVQQDLYSDIINKYEKLDTTYFDLLSRIIMFCSEDFMPLLQQAESKNKRIYLIVDSHKEAEKEGIYTDGTIYLEDIGIR